jgi:hypothetical protein
MKPRLLIKALVTVALLVFFPAHALAAMCFNVSLTRLPQAVPPNIITGGLLLEVIVTPEGRAQLVGHVRNWCGPGTSLAVVQGVAIPEGPHFRGSGAIIAPRINASGTQFTCASAFAELLFLGPSFNTFTGSVVTTSDNAFRADGVLDPTGTAC